MILFLLVIYWNHHGKNDVILGIDNDYESDEEESDENEKFDNDPRNLNFHLERKRLFDKYIL